MNNSLRSYLSTYVYTVHVSELKLNGKCIDNQTITPTNYLCNISVAVIELKHAILYSDVLWKILFHIRSGAKVRVVFSPPNGRLNIYRGGCSFISLKVHEDLGMGFCRMEK